MGCGKPCDCPTYAEHLRSITVGNSLHRAKERRWNLEMDSFRRARSYGVTPPTVSQAPEAMRALGD